MGVIEKIHSITDEDMEKLCDMLGGVYAHEEHCIYHDGIIYLDDIIKCAEFIKERTQITHKNDNHV